jgi:ATP-dependent DNA helicase RecQ
MKMINQLLAKFGHKAFLPLQEEAIESVITGQDLLLISPTGGGKSLVYQLAALRLDGVAVIVCPLLALMSQQVEKLKSMGVRAEFLNSTLNPGEQDDLAYALRDKSIDLLFLSPEKLLQPSVLGVLDHSKVAFFAIDEAHCIAQWGKGFRPEYGSLGTIRRQFPLVPIVAMSGTADIDTQKEILSSLSLNKPKVLQHIYKRAHIEITISQK